jgi:predicted MFS family arabinose efflux permease
MRSVRVDGIAGRVIASFLASAGVFYINVMPAFIDALKVSNGLSNREAGIVGAANMYGGALGSVLLALSARRVRWSWLSNRLLPLLIGLDAISLFSPHVCWLGIVRFAQGVAGGALVGVGYLVIGRMSLPNRTFGMTILLQVLLGTGSIAVLPMLVRAHGMIVVFGAMCAFSALTWILIQWLPRGERAAYLPPQHAARERPPIFALFAVALFQAGNMALYAFEVGLGEHLGHAITFISSSLALVGLLTLMGPGIAALIPPRLGYRMPLIAGMGSTIAGALLLLAARPHSIWITANILWEVSWNFGLPMLFGLSASLDPTGRGCVWAAFMSKIGLASGPLIGAWVLGKDQFPALIGFAGLLLIGAFLAAIVAVRRVDETSNAAAGP